MKFPRTVGLAVAVSLVAAIVAALAQISGAAPADPTTNVVDAAGHLRVPATSETAIARPTVLDSFMGGLLCCARAARRLGAIA